MLESRVSRILLLLGAGVGMAGVGIWALDLQPLVNVPDWILRVAMIKLTLIASAGLLAGGALVGRHARRSLSANDSARELGEGAAHSLIDPRSAKTPQGVEHRTDTPS